MTHLLESGFVGRRQVIPVVIRLKSMNTNSFLSATVGGDNLRGRSHKVSTKLATTVLGAGIASFGVAYLLLYVTVTLLLYREFKITPIRDLNYVVYAVVAAIGASAAMFSSLLQISQHSQRAVPAVCFGLTVLFSMIVYAFGLPWSPAYADGLDTFWSASLLVLSPILATTSMIQLGGRRAWMIFLPYVAIAAILLRALLL